MSTIKMPSKATFDCRHEIKSVGGNFDGHSWSVTSDQLTRLREMAATSAARFNKRDTQFGRDWARVEAMMASEKECS